MAKLESFVILGLALSIPGAAITGRYLVFRKFKLMFPDRKPRLMPPLFDVTFDQAPFGEKREIFIRYYKTVTRICLLVALSSAVMVYIIGNWNRF